MNNLLNLEVAKVELNQAAKFFFFKCNGVSTHEEIQPVKIEMTHHLHVPDQKQAGEL